MQIDDVLQVAAALEHEGVRYALFGAMAMAVHGVDRATRDLDLFVMADADNIARLRRALHAVYHDPEIELITAEDLGGDYPAIQYGPPEVDFTIDLVSRLGDAYTFEDLETTVVDVAGQAVTVVTPATLYEMKRDTVRGRDHDDAERLRHAFDLED